MPISFVSIQGMHCASCVAKVEKTLQNSPGVHQALVNLTTNKAKLEHEDGALEGALEALRELGYDVQLLQKARRTSHIRERELSKAAQRVALSLFLCLPFLLHMALVFSPWSLPFPAAAQLVLASIVQFGVAAPFYPSAFRSLKAGSANMDVLVLLGTLSAYGLSLAVMLYELPIGLYFESSVVILSFVLLGRYLEMRAKGKASQAIEELMDLQPRTARVQRDGQWKELAIEEVQRGELFQLRPGDQVPLDGRVVKGSSTLNESMLTGESHPVSKHEGDQLYAGTLNQNGSLTAKATGVGEETALAAIVRLVEEAQSSKAPIQALVDRIAAYFVPVVLLLALLTFSGWYLYSGALESSSIPAVALLVIACPCALGLATPTVITVACSLAARRGILVKNAQSLDLAYQSKTFLMDKTGTLTEGQPRVTACQPEKACELKRLLSLMFSAEQHSEHPIAQAIVDYAEEHGAEALPIEKFQAEPGKGIRAEFEGKELLLGSYRYLSEQGVTLPAAHGEQSEIYAALGGQYLGVLCLEDPLREGAVQFITELKARGVQACLFSGDSEVVVRRIAAKLGIEKYWAEQLPEDKVALVSQYAQSLPHLAVIGDGVNDAPALAQAPVSFAMASGSAVALEAADITIMGNRLSSVIEALELSKRSAKKIRQNLFFAFIYNILAIPLAALGFLSPMLAGIAMSLSSLSVVTNSLMLAKKGQSPGG